MNPHIIWKYRKLSIIAITLSLSITSNAHAECFELKKGIYVTDNSSDGIVDGGKIERIIRYINSTGINTSIVGTTGHFSPVIVVNTKTSIYKTIGNDFDENYETLSIKSAAETSVSCNKFTLKFETDKYYTNYIKINEEPKKPSTKLPYKLKAILTGEIIDSNTLLINSCTTYEFNTKNKTWGSGEYVYSLCSSPKKYKLFNIIEIIKNKPHWNIE